MESATIYTKDGCPYCRRLMEEMKSKGMEFKEINVSHDTRALKEVKEKYGATRVPVLVQGDRVTIGYKGMG
ncbi:MAG: glutaredoxin family protein [Bacillota bacterium]